MTKSMRNIYNAIIPYFISVLLLVSCGVAGRRFGNSDEIDPRTLAERDFDPMAYDEDREIITSDVPLASELDNGKNELVLPARKPETRRADQYYSVQVFASKSSVEVKIFKASIDSLFEDEVRIDYQAPYYRICVGKVPGYENGEELLARVTAMGFPKAWLVRLRN